MKKFLCVLIALPVLFSFNISARALSASAAVVINGDTGDIIYSHNADVRLPLASTTKIMTALVLLENCQNLDDEITATAEMVTVEGSSMGLLAGDRVSYRALLYGMMLASGNDAANTAAIAIGGSIEGFVELMNRRAEQLGLNNTHFVTPSGLDAEGHYTTAYDLALIAREALKNPDFAEAAAAKSATLCFGNPPYLRKISNHNRLLNMYDDVIGVKTGYTKKSGRCLVSAARNNGRYVIAVTLNDPDDWADHRLLLDTGISAIEVYSYKPERAYITVPVLGGTALSLKAGTGQAEFCIPEGGDVKAVVCAPKFLYAPVYENDIIGNICYYCSGRLIYKSNIIAGSSVQKQNTAAVFTVFEIFKSMFGS